MPRSAKSSSAKNASTARKKASTKKSTTAKKPTPAKKKSSSLWTQEEKEEIIADLKKSLKDLGRIPGLIFAPVIAYIAAKYEKIPENRRYKLKEVSDGIKKWGKGGLDALKERFSSAKEAVSKAEDDDKKKKTTKKRTTTKSKTAAKKKTSSSTKSKTTATTKRKTTTKKKTPTKKATKK